MIRPPFLRTVLTLTVLFSLACSSSTKAKDTDQEAPSPAPATPTTAEPAPSPDRGKPPATPAALPTFRGGPMRTGRFDATGPRTARLRWVFRTEGRVYAAPAVGQDGTVYVGSHDGNLYAVDKAGREKWSVDAGGKIWSSPAVASDGTIYFGSDADTFFAVNPNGEIKWTVTTTLPPEKGEKNADGKWDVDTSPAVADDGTIYFGCHYYLYALRPSGELKWQFQAGTGRVKIFSSPAIDADGHIYFGTQGKRFFALDAGANPLWNIETEKDNDSTPAVAEDGRVFFGSDDGKVRAVGAKDGAVLWEAAVGAPIRAPIGIGKGGVVLAATYGETPFLVALNPDTGEVLWRFAVDPGEGDFYGIQSGATIDAEGYIYLGARDHYVYCLSPQGQLVWRYKTGDQVDSSPVLGPDGTLYVGSDDKRLYAFETQKKQG